MKWPIYALLLVTPISILLGQEWSNPFPAQPPAAGYTLQNAFPSLSFTAPDRLIGLTTFAGKLYVVERGGKVYLIGNPASPTKVLFLDNSSETWTVGESGLMGIAFHPTAKTVFTWANETNRVNRTMVNRLARWSIDPANPARVVPGSKRVMLEQVDDNPYHSGGDIQFGPDGYLYVPLGDEGGGNGSDGNTQRIDRDFFSGILRLDVDERPGNLSPNPHPAIRGGYRVPSDNPWVTAKSFNGRALDPSKVRTEFWAVGFRNPHRISFDSNGDLYVGDVGNLRWEEFNRVVRGGNYGWNWMEGNETTTFENAPPQSQRPSVAFSKPLWAYPHPTIAPQGSDPRFIGNCAIGGLVYRGSRYPQLNGKYICADYSSKHIWAITLAPQVQIERIATATYGVHAFGINPATGEILAVEHAGGRISKLVASATGSQLPPTLSQTRAFANLQSLTAASGILPYEVASPFWSDTAEKLRWFHLPPGTSVSRDSKDNWSYPDGMVWIKHFDLPVNYGSGESRRIETRFLIKSGEGGYGVTYRWRPDQKDADLVPDAGSDTTFAVVRPTGTTQQNWHYPGRGECLDCHSRVAGFALGFSTRQLNVPVRVAGGGSVNQLLGLSNLDVFQPEFRSVSGLPRLSRPEETGFSLEHRFKSYTDANCAYCHQPGGTGRGDWDGRFSTPVLQSAIVNGPVLDNFGIPGAKLIRPGFPLQSILFRRINDRTAQGAPADYHMPPLGSTMRNVPAADLLWKYIHSLRLDWTIGTNGPSGSPSAEFAVESGRSEAKPGSPTVADDDYYFAGYYPAGFNALRQVLHTFTDEPHRNWERAHSVSDPTNRVHFVAPSPGQLMLEVHWPRGGRSKNGVTLAGFGTHQMVVRVNGRVAFRDNVTATRLQRVYAQIPSGPTSIEIVREGPFPSGESAWIVYDYLKLRLEP